MNKKITFGTDGWRGKIAEDYTFDNVRRCAQGFAEYLKSIYKYQQLKRGIVIGGDRRFHSENFTQTAAEVIAGNGIPVHFCGGGIPTPVISFSIKERKAIGGINITASHNPYSDNGFKVRDENGGAINPEELKKLESFIPESVSSVKSLKFENAINSKLIRHFNPKPAYIRQIKKLIDINPIKQSGLKILVDPMWGNGSGWFVELLGGGRTQIIEIHNERNPLFPEMARPEPIPPNINAGLQKAKELKTDVVVFTDGDADRCGFADEKGNFIDQLRVYALLAFYLLEIRKQRGPIIKTLSTTSMLELLGEKYGVEVYETGVGFKYVAPLMIKHDAIIGGEESGGYAFRGHVPERDGILAGLFFLDFIVKTGKKPSELLKDLFAIAGTHYYDRIDTTIDPLKRNEILKNIKTYTPQRIAGIEVVKINQTDGFKYILRDGSWLLIRFSGTEPLVRIYSEASGEKQVIAILNEGKKLIKSRK